MKGYMMKFLLTNFIFIAVNISWSFGLSCNDYANSIYQMKITYNPTVGYELITFHPNGILSAVDNTENGFSPDATTASQPFTAQTGLWQCTTSTKMFMRTFCYMQQTSQTTSKPSVADIYVNFNNDGTTFQGNYTYSYYNLGDNPYKSNVKPTQTFGPYTVSGEKWTKTTSSSHSYYQGRITHVLFFLFLFYVNSKIY